MIRSLIVSFYLAGVGVVGAGCGTEVPPPDVLISFDAAPIDAPSPCAQYQ